MTHILDLQKRAGVGRYFLFSVWKTKFNFWSRVGFSELNRGRGSQILEKIDRRMVRSSSSAIVNNAPCSMAQQMRIHDSSLIIQASRIRGFRHRETKRAKALWNKSYGFRDSEEKADSVVEQSYFSCINSR